MREIKFRGKRLSDGVWVFGYLFVTHMSGVYILSSQIDTKNKRGGGLTMGDKLMQHEVDPATVGQFTGLTDKAGREIWEGDMVRDHIGVGAVGFILEHCAYFVKTNEPAQYHYMLSDGQLHNTEVIGNTTDNPGLLEVTPDES